MVSFRTVSSSRLRFFNLNNIFSLISESVKVSGLAKCHAETISFIREHENIPHEPLTQAEARIFLFSRIFRIQRTHRRKYLMKSLISIHSITMRRLCFSLCLWKNLRPKNVDPQKYLCSSSLNFWSLTQWKF